MKTFLVVALLLGSAIALAPTATAEPCEVPGCQIVGAAACTVDHADELPGQWKAVVRTCTTGTA